MLDHRPTAAQMRVMRADAARARGQHDERSHDFRRVVIDDADCQQCAEQRTQRTARAS